MLVRIVYFIVLTDHKDAGSVDEGVALKTSAGIVLLVVGLVGGTSLADVLDYLEPGEAFANSTDEVLVGAARIDALALMPISIVRISLGTFATKTVDGDVAGFAVTE